MPDLPTSYMENRIWWNNKAYPTCILSLVRPSFRCTSYSLEVWLQLAYHILGDCVICSRHPDFLICRQACIWIGSTLQGCRFHQAGDPQFPTWLGGGASNHEDSEINLPCIHPRCYSHHPPPFTPLLQLPYQPRPTTLQFTNNYITINPYHCLPHKSHPTPHPPLHSPCWYHPSFPLHAKYTW